jgi:hypothetical protein
MEIWSNALNDEKLYRLDRFFNSGFFKQGDLVMFRWIVVLVFCLALAPSMVHAQGQPILPCSQGQGLCTPDGGASPSYPSCRNSREGSCLDQSGRFVPGSQRRQWRQDAQEANNNQPPGNWNPPGYQPRR